MDILVNSSGRLVFNGKEYRCALGKGGLNTNKKEGDGTTPIGIFALRGVLYRPDRVKRPETTLPVSELRQNDGWCDAPSDPKYNQHVQLPYQASAEALWRDDHLYDIFIPIGYNDEPVVPGRGSAVFLHIAREQYTPTAGCIAVAQADLQEILKSATSETKISIQK